MKVLLLTLTMILLSFSKSTAQNPNKQTNKKDTMTRIEKSKETYEKLLKQVQSVSGSDDPELMNILQRFIFGEVFFIGNLSDTTSELITITALATNQTLPQLRAHTNAALNIGVKAHRNKRSNLSVSSIYWLSESIECFRYHQQCFQGH